MKKVSIITVNFNQFQVTEALLESVFAKNTYKETEIIVVDNGSSTDPVPGWMSKYPGVRFIRSEENTGFAGGNNLGLNVATGDYLFFINNDTEITEDLIPRLVDAMETNKDAGMISPKIKYFDQPDIIQYAGFSGMNYYTARTTCIGQGARDTGQFETAVTETGFIHGAAMMVRREAIETAGRMAENYFLYYEEMDWCERIRRAGYKILIEPRAVIYHKESVSVGSTSGLKEYFMNRNRILFVRRNCGIQYRLFFWPYFMFVVATRNILSYVKGGRAGLIIILLRAIWWNLTNRTDSTRLGFTIKNRL